MRAAAHVLRHAHRPESRSPSEGPLEVEAAFAGALGERLDAPVVHVCAAIEHDLLDALLGGALGDELADGLRSVDVRAGLERFALVLLERRRGDDGRALLVVDDLRVDLLRRPDARTAAGLP